jgi:phosphatidate cytidylyltransferase
VTATASGATDREPSALGRRITSGLLLAAIVFASIATVPTFTAALLVVCLISLWELAGLTARNGGPLNFPVAAVAITVYIVLAALGLQHAYEKPLLACTIFASFAVSLAGSRQGFLARSAFTVFGVLYIGWLGSYFLALRNQPHYGATYAATSIVAIAFTDIFAMLVGTTLGRTPLTSISPRKTWEGAIGGFVATTAVCASFGIVHLLDVTWWQGALIGAITSFAAQTGDIVESALKRDALVKDTGTLLAGHGGILDRFDSYTFGGIAFYVGLYVTGHIAHP